MYPIFNYILEDICQQVKYIKTGCLVCVLSSILFSVLYTSYGMPSRPGDLALPLASSAFTTSWRSKDSAAMADLARDYHKSLQEEGAQAHISPERQLQIDETLGSVNNGQVLKYLI